MAEITAANVKDLRERTGAGMMDAKKALMENNGDMEAAVDWLRAKGLATAAKKASRVAAEGLVGVATHGGYERFINVQDLLKAADDMLYRSKSLGRNRVNSRAPELVQASA